MTYRVNPANNLKAEADRLEQFLTQRESFYSPWGYSDLLQGLQEEGYTFPPMGITPVVEELVRRGFLVVEEEPEGQEEE